MNFQFADPAMLAPILSAQVEHYFSTDNLIRDVYLRQRMDKEGWIPCAMLFDFPRVKQLCYSIEFLMASCANSKIIEVSGEHEKIRLKKGWKKWLYPGQDGKMGVPLYTKFPRPVTPLMPQGLFASDGERGESPTSDSGESTASFSSDNDSESSSPASSAPPTPSRGTKISLSVDAAEWKPDFA